MVTPQSTLTTRTIEKYDRWYAQGMGLPGRRPTIPTRTPEIFNQMVDFGILTIAATSLHFSERIPKQRSTFTLPVKRD
jgi:hypothetical protein